MSLFGIFFAKPLVIDEVEVAGEADYLSSLPPHTYCDLVTTIDKRCAETSLLEIWDFDGAIINNLTTQDILDAINTLEER